jgi:hypothetical protein
MKTVSTVGGRNVDPRCDGNIVELYFELLGGEGESGRIVVGISLMQSIYECVFVYLVKRFCASYSTWCSFLTFRGPCSIVIYSYNKTNEMHYFSQIYFGIELYMFWTGVLSIIRSLILYTRQQMFAIEVMLTVC